MQTKESTRVKRFRSTVSVLVILGVLTLVLTPLAIAQGNEDKGAPAAEQQVSTTPADKVSERAGVGPIKFAWDTTFKYSPIFRVAKQSNALTSVAANPNNSDQNDGDMNFHRGLVSNRVDVFSEMDVAFGKNFGVRASTEAWGDSLYNQKTGNTSPVTYNALSSDFKHFPADTKDFQFLNAYLMDAFAYARIPMGNSTLSLRGGQFAQVWGQTLFFGGNGIAGAMAPVDIIKLLSEPNAQFKEFTRPVPQFSMQLQINPKISIGAYYQFTWDKTWLPSVGSYFSSSDVMSRGEERFFLGGGGIYGPWLVHTPDLYPKDSGQFGVQVLINAPHGWGLGFYGAQFHDKTPELDLAIGNPRYFNPTGFGPLGPSGAIGSFNWMYAQNIKTIGVSATKTTGTVNWAAEFSGRWNQDLAISGVSDPGVSIGQFGPQGAPVANNTNNVLYPVGNTIHGNLSALWSPRPNFISKESSFVGEVAWNHCIMVTNNDTQVFVDTSSLPPKIYTANYFDATKATRDAMVFMAVYTPTYRQVRPGVDLNVPVGFQFSPYGRSVLGPGFNTYHGGFFNIGASIAYKDANRFSITYQRFIGNQVGAVINGSLPNQTLFSYGQVYGDRNYIALSIYRTFGVRASQKVQ